MKLGITRSADKVFHAYAASPILGHPKNMNLGITRSADKVFHAYAASPISGHPKNMKLGITRSADKVFHAKVVAAEVPSLIPGYAYSINR